MNVPFTLQSAQEAARRLHAAHYTKPLADYARMRTKYAAQMKDYRDVPPIGPVALRAAGMVVQFAHIQVPPKTRIATSTGPGTGAPPIRHGGLCADCCYSGGLCIPPVNCARGCWPPELMIFYVLEMLYSLLVRSDMRAERYITLILDEPDMEVLTKRIGTIWEYAKSPEGYPLDTDKFANIMKT